MPRGDDTFAIGGAPRGPAASPAIEDELAPGARVGSYRVERLLAAGGHGAVYLAEHHVLGRRAAVKVLRRDLVASAEMAARFVREAQVVNLVRHPNIVDIYDIGTLPDGRPFCVMELLEGRSLKALLAERAPLSPVEAVAYLAPVCQALQAAHEAGVVHRDVKASNVMVLAEGDPPRLKLVDFGVAKVARPGQPAITAVGTRIGTPVAMAPEQILDEGVSARTDVYALGVLLHQMLTGRYPFASDDPAELERMHLEAVPPRASALAAVPAALDAVIGRCLEKAPGRRWPSAAAVLDAAHAALGEERRALRRVPAVAIHVALGVPGAVDEEGLAAQADAADAAEAALLSAGFTLPVADAGTLLGVRLLPGDLAASHRARAEAVALARELATRLAGPRVRAAVGVHVDDAAVRDGPGGAEAVEGPICQTTTWVAEDAVGFFATAKARDGLDP